MMGDAEFKDIRITGADKNLTEPVKGRPAVFCHVFVLSDTPPAEWERTFAEQCPFPAISLVADNINITCLPAELKPPAGYFAKAKDCVAKANQAYRAHLQKQDVRQQKQADEETRRRQEVNEVLDSLDYH